MHSLGSGRGSVGRAVASNIRGPGFESSHRQLLLNIYLLLTVCRKDENKEKEAGNGPIFFKKKCAADVITWTEDKHNRVPERCSDQKHVTMTVPLVLKYLQDFSWIKDSVG